MSTSTSELSDANESETGEMFDDTPSMPLLHATHFISIPIQTPTVLENLQSTVATMRERHPIIERYEVNPAKYHVCIAVLCLRSEEQLEQTCKLFESDIKPIVTHFFKSRPHFNLQGVKDFRRSVVYAGLEEGADKTSMIDMCAAIRAIFVSHEIPIITSSEFIPHLTLMKLSKVRKGSLRRFPDRFYFEFGNQEFGQELLSSIDLCEMKATPCDQGYTAISRLVISDGGMEIQRGLTRTPSVEPVTPFLTLSASTSADDLSNQQKDELNDSRQISTICEE
jgi:2'-5' RNA ligase